jgi:hypothetical protein
MFRRLLQPFAGDDPTQVRGAPGRALIPHASPKPRTRIGPQGIPGGPASSKISHQWNHPLGAAAAEPLWASGAKETISAEFAWLLGGVGLAPDSRQRVTLRCFTRLETPQYLPAAVVEFYCRENYLHARRTSQTIIKITIIVPTTPIPNIVPPYPTRRASRLLMQS